jgi:predicted dithiol-disulfide oxidoreductase (DUF899 family)
MYNFESKEAILTAGSATDLVASNTPVEVAGLSCFIQDGGRVFHTYSAYDLGVEAIGLAKNLLELTSSGGRAPWRGGH